MLWIELSLIFSKIGVILAKRKRYFPRCDLSVELYNKLHANVLCRRGDGNELKARIAGDGDVSRYEEETQNKKKREHGTQNNLSCRSVI